MWKNTVINRSEGSPADRRDVRAEGVRTRGQSIPPQVGVLYSVLHFPQMRRGAESQAPQRALGPPERLMRVCQLEDMRSIHRRAFQAQTVWGDERQ